MSGADLTRLVVAFLEVLESPTRADAVFPCTLAMQGALIDVREQLLGFGAVGAVLSTATGSSCAVLRVHEPHEGNVQSLDLSLALPHLRPPGMRWSVCRSELSEGITLEAGGKRRTCEEELREWRLESHCRTGSAVQWSSMLR